MASRAIALLAAEALGGDHEHAVAAHAVPGERGEPLAHRPRAGWASARRRSASCTAVATLFTFCPPGPEARMKDISISFSSIVMPGAMLEHGASSVRAARARAQRARAGFG